MYERELAILIGRQRGITDTPPIRIDWRDYNSWEPGPSFSCRVIDEATREVLSPVAMADETKGECLRYVFENLKDGGRRFVIHEGRPRLDLYRGRIRIELFNWLESERVAVAGDTVTIQAVVTSRSPDGMLRLEVAPVHGLFISNWALEIPEMYVVEETSPLTKTNRAALCLQALRHWTSSQILDIVAVGGLASPGNGLVAIATETETVAGTAASIDEPVKPDHTV